MKKSNLSFGSGLFPFAASVWLEALSLIMQVIPYDHMATAFGVLSIYRYSLLVLGVSAVGLGMASHARSKHLPQQRFSPSHWLLLSGSLSVFLFFNAMDFFLLPSGIWLGFTEQLLLVLHTGLRVMFLLVGFFLLRQPKLGSLRASSGSSSLRTDSLLPSFVGILAVIAGGGVLLFSFLPILPLMYSSIRNLFTILFYESLNLETVLLGLGVYQAVTFKSERHGSKRATAFLLIGTALTTLVSFALYRNDLNSYASSFAIYPFNRLFPTLSIIFQTLALFGAGLTLVAGLYYLRQLKKQD